MVGAEAGERASVGMANSRASAESAGARGGSGRRGLRSRFWRPAHGTLGIGGLKLVTGALSRLIQTRPLLMRLQPRPVRVRVGPRESTVKTANEMCYRVPNPVQTQD